MKRLLIFITLLCLVCGASIVAEEKPNILFILADDMGWTALSCYGNKDVATTNLDRIPKRHTQ